jgi:P4 family phage/plasmid primase-like protien
MNGVHMSNPITLKQFLESHRLPNADRRPASITGMGEAAGKYLIPDEKYGQFLDLMNKHLWEDRGRPMNLVEQPQPNGPKPLTIDLDFRFRKDRSLAHPFEQSHIKAFTEKLTEGLGTFFDLNVYEDLRYFVSLRPQAYMDKKSGEIKDGVHIVCPDIILSFEKQSVLRNWMLGQDAVNQAFEGTSFTNEVSDIYDASCTRKQGWFLYGESKPDIPAYTLSYVLDYSPSGNSWSVLDSFNYDNRELLELLSVRYKLAEDDNEVKAEVKDLYQKLSTSQGSGAPVAATIATGLTAEEIENMPNNPLVKEAFEEQQVDTNYEEIDIVKQLVRECLSAKRAEDYSSWLAVGLCLHSISQSTDMFNLWMEFSAKSSKSTGNDLVKLRRKWDLSMRSEGNGRRLTIRSLRHWAQLDNPIAFKEINERDIINYILHNTLPTHNHVGRLMKRMFQDNYAASINARSTEWFEFLPEMHRWKKINQGIALRNKISGGGHGLEVTDMIAAARQRFKTSPEFTRMEAIASASKSLEALQVVLRGLIEKKKVLRDLNKIDETREVDVQIREAESSIDMITKKQDLQRADVRDRKFAELADLEGKLHNCGFKDAVMKECQGLFYEEGFEQSLNTNCHRIGCANGVLHLDAIKVNPDRPGEMIGMDKDKGDPYNFFQPGVPEDYLTFQAGNDMPEYEPIPYIEYDPTDPVQHEIDDFFAKLFPRPELRSWVLKLLASCLEGKNREQCYYTFQGVGGNGKSKLVELMIMTFGDYQSSLQSTALTRKRPESGAANPDIMSIKNKRFIYMQEPDDREPLNTSRMKQFSGEDAVEARGLFQDQERFKISGKLFMMCNTLPTINSMDRGTWRRIRLIPFESKFVNPGDKELGQPNVFPKDMNLNSKLKKWRIPFFSKLVHIYLTQYAVNDNGTLEPAPEIVTSESRKYRDTFDSLNKFCQERCRIDKDSDEQASVSDVWRAYRYWHEAVGGGNKKLAQVEFMKRFNEEFYQGQPKQAKFYNGLFVFNTEEDVAAYDEDRNGASAAAEAEE